jgi:GH24 family phage-related lysozyme (muramidase)
MVEQLHFTAFHEGFSPRVYLDSLGIPTALFGHKLTTEFELLMYRRFPHLEFSRQDGLEILRKDMEVASYDFARLFIYDPQKNKTEINEARRIVLTDMLFNLGSGRFLGFRNMIRAVRSGNWGVAAGEAMNSKWSRQVGDGEGKKADRAERIAYMLRKGEFPNEGHRLFVDYARHAG